MNLLNLLFGPDINRGVKEFRTSAGAHLLDVRTTQEYCDGHIPGSKNMPLHAIHKASRLEQDKAVPLYVYCRSGSRSRRAVQALQRMGYQNVRNIGGINAWRGALE